ncbi:MAG: protein BatD [Candidatus Omnitrophica bacterium]|nr:protein BatD [Candidatus Omnitrophota bacterium]
MLKKIGSPLIMGVLISFLSITAGADGEKVSMSVSQKEIILGDSVILTIIESGVANPVPPVIPEIPGFNIKYRGARQEGFSSMTVIINGRQVKNESTGGGYSFDFELMPVEKGTFTVPSIPVNVNGKRFMTEPFQVNVLDQSEKRGDIFLDARADKTEAYLGEKIVLTFKWYFSKDIGNYSINVPWLDGLKNFLISDPPMDDERNYQRLIVNGDKQIPAQRTREFFKGQEYMVISFQKILTPVSAGIYPLEPVFLKCDVVTGYKRSRPRSVIDSFFDSDMNDFFGLGRDAVTEPFAARSNDMTLTVKEVPGDEKPVGYNGAVGKFTFDVDVKPVALKAGEPITLTMKVRGSGNIEQLELPQIPGSEDFKSYEPESKVNVSQSGGESRGEKVFEKVLIPRSAGDFRIPDISFIFFNPSTGKYQTEKRGPFNIHVAPAEKETEVQVVTLTPEGGSGSDKRELKVLKKDIHYIMTDIGKVVKAEKPAYEDPAVWLFSFLPPLVVYIGMFFAGTRRRKLDTDAAFARSRGAFRRSREFFRNAEGYLRKGETRDFYDTLIKGLNMYLSEKLNRQLGSVGVTIADELGDKCLAEKEREELKALYHSANEAVYSSMSADTLKLEKDFKTANDIVARLERTLR